MAKYKVNVDRGYEVGGKKVRNYGTFDTDGDIFKFEHLEGAERDAAKARLQAKLDADVQKGLLIVEGAKPEPVAKGKQTGTVKNTGTTEAASEKGRG